MRFQAELKDLKKTKVKITFLLHFRVIGMCKLCLPAIFFFSGGPREEDSR